MINVIIMKVEIKQCQAVGYCKLAAKNISIITLSGKRYDCFMFTILPAALKACSDKTEVADGARRFVANYDGRG